jgi:hypothetical protein
MARQTNAIATELDLKFAIDNNILLERFALPEYTGRCITKQRVGGLVFVNETALSGLANNQLVKWDLLERIFVTSLSDITFGQSASTTTWKVSSKFGWTSEESASWFSISPTSNSLGVKEFDLIINAKTDTGNRNANIVFTENTTGNTITVTITQEGTAAASYDSITLFTSGSSATICDSVTSGTYYVNAGVSLFGATELKTDAAGTTNAASGYYRQSIGGWRFWTGTAFTTDGECGGGGF